MIPTFPIVDKHTPLFDIWVDYPKFSYGDRLWKDVRVDIIRALPPPWKYKFDDLINCDRDLKIDDMNKRCIRKDFFLESEKVAIELFFTQPSNDPCCVQDFFLRHPDSPPVFYFNKVPAPQIKANEVSISEGYHEKSELDRISFFKDPFFDCWVPFEGYFLLGEEII